jgi:hypothetical protein
MSTLALKKILEELNLFNAKEVRKETVDKQAQALIVVKSELKQQISSALKREYRLTDEQIQEVNNLINKKWPFAVFQLKKLVSTGNREIIFKNDEFIIMEYGPKSNYNALYDFFMRAGRAGYEAFWGPILRDIKKYLIEQDKRIQTTQITKGAEKGKLREAFTAADLFDLGHYSGSSIHYAIFSKFLPEINENTGEDLLQVLNLAPVEVSPFHEDRNVFMEISSKFSQNRPEGGDFKKTITLRVEDKIANRRKAQEEKKIRDAVILHVKKVLSGLTPVEWANQESSDSVITAIGKTLVNEAIRQGAKGKRRQLITPASKADKKTTLTTKGTRTKVGVKAGRRSKQDRPIAQPSYLALITLINSRLPPQVRSNMGTPRLNNRTGRLSESARVTNIVPTPQGFPSIEYTYQRNPYDVFDKTLGRDPWNTPARDPSELVGMSVRQIATEIGMRKFYTRRAR